MSRVFVVQQHMHWDAGKQALVPKFDLSSALEYGELMFLLSSSFSPFNPNEAIRAIREAMEIWRFGPEDHLLLIGNPCLIAWSAALAADRTGGRLRLLQWSGKERKYLPVDSTVWTDY